MGLTFIEIWKKTQQNIIGHLYFLKNLHISFKKIANIKISTLIDML